MKSITYAVVLSMALLLTACSSSPKSVPIKVYTEPAGSYVIYRVDSGSETDSPWIYLGITPLESTLSYDKKIRKAKKISIKVMKEGYFDINKDWEPEKLKDELKERNMIFWNPGLVQQNRAVPVPYRK